jgi:hypothetical protein
MTKIDHLAEPEGYVRVFVDEGSLMRALLAKVHELSWKRPRATSTAFPSSFASGDGLFAVLLMRSGFFTLHISS